MRILGELRDLRASAPLDELIESKTCPNYIASDYLVALNRLCSVESPDGLRRHLEALRRMPLRRTNEAWDRHAARLEKMIKRRLPVVPAPPALQRMKILDDVAYVFDFDVPRGPQRPALVELSRREQASPDALKEYYLFGLSWPSTPRGLLRWDVADGMVFCTYHHDFGPFRGTTVNRYPLDALVEGPDFRIGLDRSRPGAQWPAPTYASLRPERMVYTGFRWDEEGRFKLSHKGIDDDIYWDIRALDHTRLELFMTVYGNLSIWLFDGDKWHLLRDHVATIVGPFMVWNQGRAALAEQDGHWCIIAPLDGGPPQTRPIIQKVPDKPLLLIEDVVTGANWFLHNRVMYEEDGSLFTTLPPDAQGQAVFRWITDFVHSRREQ